MAWLIGEIWLPLAFLAGFASAWAWQRSALTPRIRSLEEELSLCRHRSTEIDNERKQALARIKRSDDGGSRGRSEHDVIGRGGPARLNA